METLNLAIDGMSCDHCVRAVNRALDNIDGVAVEDVAVGSARVTYDPKRVKSAAILDAITAEGFTPTASDR
ncbi:MAG: hypothetical protein NVS1B4_12840 [Gemmatimonadaceae bacterium]